MFSVTIEYNSTSFSGILSKCYSMNMNLSYTVYTIRSLVKILYFAKQLQTRIFSPPCFTVGWNTVVSFSFMFVSWNTPMCYCQKSPTCIHQLKLLFIHSSTMKFWSFLSTSSVWSCLPSWEVVLLGIPIWLVTLSLSFLNPQMSGLFPGENIRDF